MKNRTRINLKFVDDLPPKQSTAIGKPEQRRSIVEDFLNRLSKHPNQWAVYSRSGKSSSHLYKWRKKFPTMEIATRNNSDGTRTIYVRIVQNPIHYRNQPDA